MGRYLLTRLGLAIPTVLAVSAITFFLAALAPSDPATIRLGEHAQPAVRRQWLHQNGLDRPLLVQYVSFLAGALHGDLGRSFVTDRPVVQTLEEGLPNTALLALAAMLLASFAGVALGTLAATEQDTWLDRACMVGALGGVSLPPFVLAPMLMLIFSLGLRWLPVSGWGDPRSLVLPALVLAGRPAALIARLTRAEMVGVLRQEYMDAARARGLSRWQAIRKHALRNAMLPVLTVIGTSFGYLLSGSFVVETIFGVPGIGKDSVASIFSRDYRVIQGTTLVMAVGFVGVNLVVDLLYAVLDPRIRYGWARRPSTTLAGPPA